MDEAVAPSTRAVSRPTRVLLLAVAAALAIKVPALFGLEFEDGGGRSGDFYLRNLGLFCLPFLAVHLLRNGTAPRRLYMSLALVFAVGAAFTNAYPFESSGSTTALVAIHMPVALWAVVGVAHSGVPTPTQAQRLAFVRFTGEWFIRYALLALGGMVLMGLAAGAFTAAGLSDDTLESMLTGWLLPCGAMGAVVVAAWMAEEGQGATTILAPTLARVFTPLFTVFLAALLVTVTVSGEGIGSDREVLILFDLVLVVVLGLVLYTTSARGPGERPTLLDRLSAVLITCAVGVDTVALVGIARRIGDHGLSPNRTAALGLNLLLLVNLVWSLVLLAGFLLRRRPFGALEVWQARFLPAFPAWAVLVVVAFPPAFGFA
ncbi:MAG: hypothetical protein ISR43_01010 [Acidimicrobiia bacterium]|nr:hypothetical protein [Actinomycetota bacterium]MBL6924736.1 hypothetical protein [Acidimicrobiia bacterium]MBL6925792.1 hypothetical protein [Acidimicrobiia bacterium]